MPTPGSNQFLPFATASGANVLTPADYAALAALAQGFQSGIAKSQYVNTPLRQATFVAAAIAQIIANSGVNANDDGNVSTFVTNFLAAVYANAPLTGNPTAPTQAVNDASTKLANTAFVTNQINAAFNNNASLAYNGYQKLPSGLLMQWCSGTVMVPTAISSAGVLNLTFPLAFTNLFHVWTGQELGDQPPGNEIGEMGFGVSSSSTTGCSITVMRNQGSNSGAETVRITALAFGR